MNGIASSLKDATSAKHRAAEQCAFNQRMFNGELTPGEYALYLVQMRAVFEALEERPLPHPALNRVESLAADLKELHDKGVPDSTVLASAQAYADHVRATEAEHHLAHVYLNYLALMFGGQIIKQRVPSAGAFYAFNDTREAMAAIRSVQQDAWADEVNRGFDFHIAIYEELQSATS